MAIDLELTTFVGFLLALARTTAWMAVAPPFYGRMMPRLVKLGAAAGISMAIAHTLPADQMTLEPGPLMVMVLMQVATGLILGFLTQILFAAIGAAGGLIDIFGGFTLSQAFDPFMNNQSSIFGRFYGLIATTLLFVINGHLLLIKGFMTSFDAVPLGGIALDSFKEVLFRDLALFGIAAVEIAGPLIAAYFLADVALGLMTKAAPQLNVLVLSFPLKILLTLLMVGAALPLIIDALNTFVNQTLEDGSDALRSGRG